MAVQDRWQSLAGVGVPSGASIPSISTVATPRADELFAIVATRPSLHASGGGGSAIGGIRHRQRLATADSRQTEDGGALEGGEARRRRSQTGLRCAQRSDIGLGCAQNFPFPLGCVSAQSTTLPRLMGGQAECGHVCSADSCLTTEPPARSSQVPRHPQCPQAVALMLTRSRPRHAFNVAAHSSWATLALRRPNGRVSGTARRSRA